MSIIIYYFNISQNVQLAFIRRVKCVKNVRMDILEKSADGDAAVTVWKGTTIRN